MREHRLLIAVIAVLAVGLLAAGCGGDDDDQASDDPGAELKPNGAEAEDVREERGRNAEEAEAEEARGERRRKAEEAEAEEAEEATLDPAARRRLLRTCRRGAEDKLDGEALEQALEQCEAEYGG